MDAQDHSLYKWECTSCHSTSDEDSQGYYSKQHAPHNGHCIQHIDVSLEMAPDFFAFQQTRVNHLPSQPHNCRCMMKEQYVQRTNTNYVCGIVCKLELTRCCTCMHSSLKKKGCSQPQPSYSFTKFPYNVTMATMPPQYYNHNHNKITQCTLQLSEHLTCAATGADIGFSKRGGWYTQ